MIAVCVTGASDAGKTTLIERLVPVLAERGPVATVKSIHHDVEVDEPGKDTHRHREAGAEATVGVTPSRTFGFVERGKATVDAGAADCGEAAALEPVLSTFADRGVDYALVEGFASASLPKVVVGVAEGDSDAEEYGVVDPIVARVDDGETADLGSIVDAIRDVRGYETTASVLERERRSDPGATVAVASGESSRLADATDWTHDRIEEAVGSIHDALGDRPGVDRVTVHLRPPVAPGRTATVHVAVSGADTGGVFAAAAEAGDRLAGSSAVDGPVEYVIQERT